MSHQTAWMHMCENTLFSDSIGLKSDNHVIVYCMLSYYLRSYIMMYLFILDHVIFIYMYHTTLHFLHYSPLHHSTYACIIYLNVYQTGAMLLYYIVVVLHLMVGCCITLYFITTLALTLPCVILLYVVSCCIYRIIPFWVQFYVIMLITPFDTFFLKKCNTMSYDFTWYCSILISLDVYM